MARTKSNIQVIGQAEITTITCKCEYCNKSYIMTCEDYVLNLGAILKSKKDDDVYCQDGWICPDCVEEILRIKNI